MALVAMMETGLLKFIISQNVDGLHRKSGVKADQISELHGNTNIEICSKCQREYLRDFRVRNAQ
jgi:NAD-dependent SIR2 family protein deacetylase